MTDIIQADVIPKIRLKRDIVILDGKRGGLEFRVKRNHIPLNKYLSAGHITLSQFKAGERLYRLYVTSSHVHTPVQMRYSDLGASLKEYEKKFIINQEYMNAVTVIPYAFRKIVQLVCIDNEKCGRGRMELLCHGLNSLVMHFKFDIQKPIRYDYGHNSITDSGR